MRTNPWTGAYEDDMERFFRRSPFDVHSADVWRWRAGCQAERDLSGEKT